MIRKTKHWAEEWRSSTLARDSSWMLLGQGLKIVVQAGYFILIARALGPAQFGAFVGTVALVTLVAPFSSIGSGNLLVQSVSRNRELFAEYWGNALLVLVVSGLVLIGLVVSLAHLILPASIPWIVILLVSVADILAIKFTEIGAQAFQATDLLRFTSFLTFLPYLLRLLGAIVLYFTWPNATALHWAWIYLACSALSALVAVFLVTYRLGAPRFALARIPEEFEQGFYFSTSMSAQTVYNDIDKTMLARLSTLDATGIYAAAYRLIDVSFTPVRSVLFAAYANFFRHGQAGIAVSYSYAKKILPKMMGYSLAIFVGLFVAAPIVPMVLGRDYAAAVEALRWLALLPFFKAMHYFLADSLSGAGYQRIRTLTQIGIAVFNVAINFWLIPAYSWRGAAWASLASDGALVIAMYAAVMFVMAKEARLGVNFAGERLEEF